MSLDILLAVSVYKLDYIPLHCHSVSVIASTPKAQLDAKRSAIGSATVN